ncbi:MAG: LacI family DNA-binding transcriptional regulator [Stomatobaculum sp.]|nr:LacI family DNA-binding transcriptional regulator [Stomatobaculum sp.]
MTIYDIAKEAGVSASTVSRVMNGKPGIGEKTRKRIQNLLKKYNYIPNESARSLSTSETRLIGILLEDTRNAHHALIAYTLEQALTARGYAGIILNTGTADSAKEEYVRLLTARNVDGVILVGSTYQNTFMKQLIRSELSDVPVVIANGWLNLPNVYGVLVDEEKGTEHCADLLLSGGRKHIVFALPSPTPSNINKLYGYRKSLRSHGIPDSAMIIREDCLSPEDGVHAADWILENHPEADGILFGEDLPAIGFIRRMAERGIAVPGRIAVIGVNNSSYCVLSHPQLTSLDNRPVEMCEEAVRTLIAALNGENPPQRIMLPCSIAMRESV